MSDEIITPPHELFEFFKKRTQLHHDLVYRNMMHFAIDKKGSFNSAIEERAGIHDVSKFEKPEMPGFIWLTAYYWLQKKNPNFEYTKDDDKQIQYVYEYMASIGSDIELDKLTSQLKSQFSISFEHHYANNRHHPEYHANLLDMTDLDLIEMVCDWTAMSQELKQDNGSAKAWADMVIGERFAFTSCTRDDYIYEQIDFLDEANKQPLFVCKRSDIY